MISLLAGLHELHFFRNDYCYVWYRYVWIHASPCAWKPKAAIRLGLCLPQSLRQDFIAPVSRPHYHTESSVRQSKSYVRWDCWGDSLRGPRHTCNRIHESWFPWNRAKLVIFYPSFSFCFCFFFFVRTAVSSSCKWFGHISLVQIYNPGFKSSNLEMEWQFL